MQAHEKWCFVKKILWQHIAFTDELFYMEEKVQEAPRTKKFDR